MEKTKESKLIYSGRILNLIKDRVELPSGRESTREVVIHRGSVAIIPFDEKTDTIFFVKQYRYPFKKEMIEIPAGTLEEGEDPFEAANRELSEEIGFFSKDLKKLKSIASSPGFLNEVLHIFLAKNLVVKKKEKDFDENIQIIKVKRKEIKNFLLKEDIVDGKTLAAFLLWEFFDNGEKIF
ncbi:MAG: NUDIX hydrolase [bacterium]|nr:MAG: NUDIX hydrolase [candidate division TA06 bacterium 32_111]KUK87812.1 MAG: NUDIX hydrolase [candidate division TA06 bacterium 34_109]MDI6700655.1 NUDIX hydrolase [bacterium]